MAEVGVLIAAAGRGERAGAGVPKQFRAIAGVPMLLRAIRPFASHPEVRHIVVAIPPDVTADPPAWLVDATGERVAVVAGGATRAASVRAALGALDGSCSVVLVHDAARPFVSRDTVDAVIRAAATGVGAVPGVPESDTLKRVNDARRIEATVDRRGLWRAHTPQGFPRRVLEDALTRAGDNAATDEAAMVEAAGHPVQLVPDRTSNFKITTAEDFALAEAVARP